MTDAHVTIEEETAAVVVAARGEIDAFTVSQLREALHAVDGRPLVVDLSRVSFIDSAGLGALVGAHRRASEHGTSLRVVVPEDAARRAFALTGLDLVLDLRESRADALGGADDGSLGADGSG